MEFLLIILIILGGLCVALGLQSKKCNIINLAVCLVISAIIGCALSRITFYATSIVIFVAVNCLIYYETCNISYSITISSLTLTIVMLSDSLLPVMCVLVEHKDINDILFGYKYSYITYILSVVIISIIIGVLLGKMFNKKMKMNETLFTDSLGHLAGALSLLSVVLIFVNNCIGKSFGFNNDFIIVNGFFVSMFFITVMVVVISLLQNMVIKLEYKHNVELSDNLMEYIKDLELLYKNMREFRHDYKNILFSMSSYINNNDYDELKKYFYDKIYPLKNSLDETVISADAINNIKVREIQSILAIKQIFSINHDVHFNIDTPNEVDCFSMDTIDLVRVLGILLDNAIEAALQTDIPTVNVAIQKNKNFEMIVVENTVKENKIQFDKIFDYGYSTKGDENRGVGLSSFISIVEKYENITYDFSGNDNVFRAEITISDIIKQSDVQVIIS